MTTDPTLSERVTKARTAEFYTLIQENLGRVLLFSLHGHLNNEGSLEWYVRGHDVA
jgi:hypothetical protein